jgi:F-type H+-transporting ATPase subunit epsilon
MATLKLSILSPERRFVEDVAVDEVTLHGSEGEIQILPGHAAMIGTLENGEFNYRPVGGQKTTGVISSGFFEVRDDQVSVLAETLEVRGESAGSPRTH